MRTPTAYELQQLMHVYDPQKAHQYYEEHKKLKGRKRGAGEQPSGFERANARRHESAKAKQKKELAARIQGLEQRLQKLEALIRKKEHEEASENRKAKAKKERAAKERDKPKTAAEKAKAAREAEKYRDKHKQELRAKSKHDRKSDGSSKDKKSSAKKHSVSELKSLATRVRGQLAVAKQKLAAL